MKLGLISDVHGDHVALELAWSHLIVMGADRVVCAGDLVGYGPCPDRVVSFMRERQVSSVRGNHDRWALERGAGVPDEFGGGSPGLETLEYLRGLPSELLVAHHTTIGVVVHGSPRSDMEFVTSQSHPGNVLRQYLVDLSCELLVVGHTHQAMWFRCQDGMVVNPGSVVSAAHIDSSRTFALVDLERMDVTFHDVETGATVEIEPWD